MKTGGFLFSSNQIKEIELCIQNAELNTSGEIRVHIDKYCKGDALDFAKHIFHKQKMHETLLRNGVLFFLATKHKKFAIVGDEGIHKNVPEGFWDAVRNKMQNQFREGKFTEGLCDGIEMTSIELKKYFPRLASDKNELSNEVTFGDN